MGALALAATSAAGTSECARVGGNEHQFHEPLAARNAVLAAMFAPVVGEVAASAFEGSAGFFNAFVGAARAPTHHFLEGDSASIEEVTGTLGQDYRILDVTFKPYPVPGFNNPIVELLKRIQRDHSIDPQDVDRVEVELNWLETTYPSPEFPRRELQQRRVGTTPYVVAQTLCDGDYARYGQWFEHGLGKGQAGERSVSDFVLTLMDKVNISSSRDRPHFAPRITISRTSGERIVDEFNGDEFKWDFDETARRAYDLAAEAGVTAEQVEGLVEAVRTLELASSLDAFTLAVSAGPW
jgi:2-methylcitrate dehydratase PrpD